jgi:hypothetical protein
LSSGFGRPAFASSDFLFFFILLALLALLAGARCCLVTSPDRTEAPMAPLFQW